MNSVYVSSTNLCAVSFSFTSVSIVILFPLRNGRSKFECAQTMRVGMVLVVRPYIQACARPNKFHHLTYLREARFTRQLNNHDFILIVEDHTWELHQQYCYVHP